MRNEQTHTDAEALRVVAPVFELDIPVCSELLTALPDPADPDQAVLVSVPFLVDGLNFGDIVRLGDADDAGARPILEAVVASGHRHLVAATEPGGAQDLAAELERMFPAYALRIARANDRLVSVSIHPDVEPDAVARVIAGWLGQEAIDDHDLLSMGAPCATELGLVDWQIAA